MDNQDIIDVEVEETVIEEDNNQTHYSDEEIDKFTQELKSLISKNNYEHNLEIEDLSKKIAINSKDYLDNETYYWVMFAYSLKYKNTNPNAEIYTMMRIRSLLKAMNNKTKKPQALTFNEFESDSKVDEAVATRCSFLDETIKKSLIKLLWMEVFFGIAFVLICFALLNFSITYAIGIAIIVTILNFVMSYGNITKTYEKNQMLESRSYCKDQELLEFDLPVINS